MANTLDGQVAIISGGAGDIGRAIARELAERGARIAICDIKPAGEVSAGVDCHYRQVDVSHAEQVARWVDAVEREVGVATLIVPNAAIVNIVDFLNVTPQQWDRELRINLNGAFYMAQAACRRLVHHKKPGRVVFIGSWAAHAPHPNIPAYCAAKAGLRMLCRTMAVQLAPHGILVNEVAPGYVDAGLTAMLWARTPGSRERAADRVPTGELIEAREVALQVAHLCDPVNRHMTGSVVLMDGGLSLVTPGNR